MTKQALAHHLTASRRGRCRQSTRRRLARVLDVSEAWLGGEQSQVDFDMKLGREFLYSRLTALAATDLLKHCEKAYTRDRHLLDHQTEDSAHQYYRLRKAILAMLCVGSWHLNIFRDWKPADGILEPRGHDPLASVDQRSSFPNHEAAILALVKAWEHVLTPWFAGEAKLDLMKLEALVGEGERLITTHNTDQAPQTRSRVNRRRRALQKLFERDDQSLVPWPMQQSKPTAESQSFPSKKNKS